MMYISMSLWTLEPIFSTSALSTRSGPQVLWFRAWTVCTELPNARRNSPREMAPLPSASNRWKAKVLALPSPLRVKRDRPYTNSRNPIPPDPSMSKKDHSRCR